MWKNLSMFGGDEEEHEENLLGDESDSPCSSLSQLQRIYGFAASLLAGLVFMLLSMIVIVRPIKFALLFTFGNILAVGSTAFLIGPAQQLRMMFDPVRVCATAIYIGSVILALIFALGIHSKILTAVAIITEICALIWYGLSYIPFAGEWFLSCLSGFATPKYKQMVSAATSMMTVLGVWVFGNLVDIFMIALAACSLFSLCPQIR